MFDQKDFQSIKGKFDDLKAERKYLLSEIKQKKEEVKSLNFDYEDILKARGIIQIVSKATQQRLEKRIGDLVSMALEIVFPDPYTFQLEFVERRNKTECDIWFVKRGQKVHPMDCSGGGPKDIASFAARIAFWALEKKTRPLIIADEPFPYLHSPIYQENCSEMINELSESLGMQMILVTDQRDIDGDNIINIGELVND